MTVTAGPVPGTPTRRGVSGPWKLIASRLVFLVVALFGVTTISFFLINLTPGDPARLIAGPLASDDQIAAIRADLGMDKSVWSRYGEYLVNLLHGDLGTSYYTHQPVLTEIKTRLPATLELVIPAVIFAALVGVAAGSVGAYFRGRFPDKATRFFTGIFQAIPDFFLALILVFVVFFKLGLAPAPAGRLAITQIAPPDRTGFLTIDSLLAGDLSTFTSALSHMALPVITLGLVYSAYFSKTARSTIGRALNSQQAQFARALGLRERSVVRYAFVEARSTIVTYAGVIFAALVGGEAIIEKIFAWNGIGQWALEGITKLDVPVIQGMVLTAGAITLITYTVLDIVVGLLDPRISRA